jgi:protein-S-isoprenylcysteine O-methyltransferase Ste14
MSQPPDLILLTLLWLGYFLIHSLLASLTLKQWVAHRYPDLLPWYRMLFNLFALILIIPPLLQLWWLQSEPLWRWEGPWAWLAYGLMLLACLGFAWSLRYYDSREFLGLKQLARHQQEVADQERLHISPLHRIVRHPWYSLGLVLVWTQDMDSARLVSALCITLYLIYGSVLEERKLISFHGDRYRAYRKTVPGLIPCPWRYLTKQQAEQLLGEHNPDL